VELIKLCVKLTEIATALAETESDALLDKFDEVLLKIHQKVGFDGD